MTNGKTVTVDGDDLPVDEAIEQIRQAEPGTVSVQLHPEEETGFEDEVAEAGGLIELALESYDFDVAEWSLSVRRIDGTAYITATLNERT